MNKTVRLALIFWLPAAAWASVIYYFSSLGAEQLPKIDIPNFDKIAHLFEYLILGLLTMRAFANTLPKVNPSTELRVNPELCRGINLKKIILLTIIVTSLYAWFDEWRQRAAAGRSACDIYDFLADFTGICIGTILYRRISVKCRR